MVYIERKDASIVAFDIFLSSSLHEWQYMEISFYKCEFIIYTHTVQAEYEAIGDWYRQWQQRWCRQTEQKQKEKKQKIA